WRIRPQSGVCRTAPREPKIIGAMEELIIEPGRAERNYWRDLWRFRELLYFLAYRDILVRYKQTVIGVAWALIRPALTMLVFVAFRRMTKQVNVGAPD